MITTYSLLPPDLISKTMESAQKWGAEMIHIILKTTLTHIMPYWPYVFGIIFILVIFASIKALSGRTGALGSLLYHIFYIAIFGIIIWINGIEIIFNPFFDLICFIIYTFCYWIVGLILQKFR
jgi:ABC-type methionine transport system permease subunit